MNPVIKAEDAACAIIKGLKKGKAYVMLPPLSIYGSMVLKLLPTPIFDWMLSISGGSVAMDSFTGRK
jgi:hypothetical protein